MNIFPRRQKKQTWTIEQLFERKTQKKKINVWQTKSVSIDTVDTYLCYTFFIVFFLLSLSCMNGRIFLIFLQTKIVRKWIIFTCKWHSWLWYYTGYFVNELIYTYHRWFLLKRFEVFHINWKKSIEWNDLIFWPMFKTDKILTPPPHLIRSIHQWKYTYIQSFSSHCALWQPFASDYYYVFPRIFPSNCIVICIATKSIFRLLSTEKTVRPVALSLFIYSFSFFIEFKSKWRTYERMNDKADNFMPSLEMLSSIKKKSNIKSMKIYEPFISWYSYIHQVIQLIDGGRARECVCFCLLVQWNLFLKKKTATTFNAIAIFHLIDWSIDRSTHKNF